MLAFSPSLGAILTSVSYAMVALQICDWFNALPFEIQFLWRKGFTLPKFLYFFSQYVSMAAQIANLFAMRELFGQSLISKRHCQLWYMFVVVIAELLLVSLEVALVHRVYAMFEKNKPLLSILSFLVLSELMVVILVPLMYLLDDDVIGGACEVSNSMPLLVLVIPGFQVANQCILFFLTLSKVGIRGVPILSVMIKDGAMLFMSCFILMTAVGVQIALSSLQYGSPLAYHVLFPIYVGIVSILTCHLIRHMEEVSRTQPCLDNSSTSFVLSSIASTSITSVDSESTSSDTAPSRSSAGSTT